MSTFGINDKELSENLFMLCLQADAAFDQQIADNLNAASIQAKFDPTQLDHRELLVFYLWLARRVVGESPKVLNALQTAYFLVSANSPFNAEDGQKVFQEISQRFYEYDQAMFNAPEHLDVMYVSSYITQRAFAKCPELLVHMPKLEMMISRLMTEWIISVTKTLKELS